MNTQSLLRYLAAGLIGTVGLAGCDDQMITPTASRALSGPTVEASATFLPQQPTDIPFDAYASGQNDPTAAALPPGGALPPLALGTPAADSGRQPVTVTALDGTLLAGDYYRTEGQRLPGVLMLAADRNAWSDFPARIHAAGYTVLAVNLRPDGPLLDFNVMMQALTSGDADPANLAVIGAGAGADAAILGCAGEPLCDTVVALSPSGNRALMDSMAALGQRSLMLSASQDDPESFGMVEALQGAAQGEVLVQPFTSAGRGTDLLINRPDLGDLIIAWLERQVGG